MTRTWTRFRDMKYSDVSNSYFMGFSVYIDPQNKGRS